MPRAIAEERRRRSVPWISTRARTLTEPVDLRAEGVADQYLRNVLECESGPGQRGRESLLAVEQEGVLDAHGSSRESMDLHAMGSDLRPFADIVPAFVGRVVAVSGERLAVADGS